MEIDIAHYIINTKQQSKAHGAEYELHNVESCPHAPKEKHWFSIGYFSGCRLALEAAKQQYPEWASRIDGCYWCCNECHEG